MPTEVEDFRVFRATKGSTQHWPLVFGVETAIWTVAAKKAGKWYRGVLEAVGWFMVRWHKDEADASRKRHASAVGGAQWNGKGGAKMVGKQRWTKAGRSQQTG